MDGYRAETFRQEFLRDAAFGDFQGLWEPVRRLRQFGVSVDQAAALAEAVLHDLLESDLIYLFRCANQEELPTLIEDRAARLSRKEAEIEIESEWWRAVPPGRADVWIATTDAGEAAALTFGGGEVSPADE